MVVSVWGSRSRRGGLQRPALGSRSVLGLVFAVRVHVIVFLGMRRTYGLVVATSMRLALARKTSTRL